MKKYSEENSFQFDEKLVDRVTVLKIAYSNFIGKNHKLNKFWR